MGARPEWGHDWPLGETHKEWQGQRVNLASSFLKKKYYIYLFVWCVCARTHTCANVHMVLQWRSEDNVRESVLSFQQACLGGQTPGQQARQQMPSFYWAICLSLDLVFVHVNDHDYIVIGRLDRTRQKQQRGHPKYILTSWHVPKVIIFSETPRKNLLSFLVHLFNK